MATKREEPVPVPGPTPKPPVARVDPVEHRLHDDVRIDPYYWLRERDNPAVLDYLTAENAYTESVMAGTADLQKILYTEMRGRIKETDETVPVRIDDYFYYKRTEEGKQYPIYCRKQGSLDAGEELLLDLNAEAEGYDYLRMANFAVSPDHTLLAYALDTDGSETYTLRIKDLAACELRPDTIAETYYGLAWSNDSRSLYYVTLDPAKRPCKLLRHRLGTEPITDSLVYHEEDESYFLGLRKSKSRRYIFVDLNSTVTSEVYFLDADQADAAPVLIQERIHRMEYSVSHHRSADGQDQFFILTNWEAENFRLMAADVHAPGRQGWRQILPHRPSVKLDGVECFADHIVIYEREAGLPQIRIQDPNGQNAHRVPLKDPVYTLDREPNPVFDTELLRFGYSSLVQPKTICEYAMHSLQTHTLKLDEVAGYDATQFESERVWATAPDGTRIPISLLYRKDIVRDGHHPTLLYGYGSYGVSLDPGFNSNRLSLVERGFIYAIAHIRGGGEMGRAWYEDGKLHRKRNTFADFIACAEHLVNHHYTRPQSLVAMGRSAGGLLMGTVANLRPDLFAGIVAGVPFVDVVTTMLDPSIPLTVIEWEEWGDPNQPDYYQIMKSYSPYDNVTAQEYPAILATGGLNDPRVQYWEPAKWVAKLRTVKQDDSLLLLKTNMGAGHGGASGRFDYLEELAFEYAFILTVVEEGEQAPESPLASH